MKEKRKRFIQVFALALIMLLIASSTYAYFAAQYGEASSTDITVTTSTVDSLTFETGDAISINATQSNFGIGDGNQSDETYASATLVANNDTNSASANYYLYIKIDTNDFEYTTSDKTAELILTITDPEGNDVSSLSGLNYTSVTDGEGNTISGFDITSKIGLITIADNYLIESTGTNIQEWNIEVILVNLDSDQSDNAGKSFSASLVIQSTVYGNTLQAYEYGKFWGYYDSITKIVFDDSGSIIDTYDYIYDISESSDESILAYVVNNGNDTYTTYIVSSLPILGNEDMSWWFADFTLLEEIDGLDKLITSNVTNMSGMFCDCSSLTILDLSSWDTSNVANMSYMFSYCDNLISLDLSTWYTSNVTTMNEMFRGCSSLMSLDLGSFDTSNVTDMKAMFADCTSLTSLDLSSFNTSNVLYFGLVSTTPSGMFENCSSLTSLDLSSFDTSKVIDMSRMFENCSSLTSLDLSNFDTSNVMYMSSMFYDCSSLTSLDLSSFDTSNVTDMSFMFYGCSSLISLDLGSFDTSNVTNMAFMFYGCSSLVKVDMSRANFSNVTSYTQMFYNNNSSITVTVKDSTAQTFIQARLNQYNSGTVVIA